MFLRSTVLVLVAAVLLPLAKGTAAKRLPWDGSRMASSPIPASPLVTTPAFPKLKFRQPVEIRFNGTLNRFFVLELRGRLYSFPPDPKVEQADLILDIKSAEPSLRQALGFTFHPNFVENRELFVCYSLRPKQPDGSHLVRYRLPKAEVPATVDPDSRERLLTWLAGGHNGCSLNFGPDGMLYISTGDAEAPYPPDELKTGQDISDLLASILRIDVDRRDPGLAYHIPLDNPFTTTLGARREVWAYGFRNPWRMSFDFATGDLWVGDVGWDLWEMIFRVERGGNYGWSIMEGSQPIHPDDTPGPTPITAPVVQHSHTESRSITGGYVYRGKQLPEQHGMYIYGDYATGRIWGLRHDGKQVTEQTELANTSHQTICFGVDSKGELLVVDYRGTLHRLIPNPASRPAEPFPTRLSDTGLFSDLKSLKPAAGAYAYDIQSPMWQDGAVAQRLIAIPGFGGLDRHPSTNQRLGFRKGEWRFPDRTVLAKTLTMPVYESSESTELTPRKLETQVLQLVDGFWQAYSFIWNADGTDAELSDGKGSDTRLLLTDENVPGGRRELNWHFASRAECLLCHNQLYGTVNGLTAEQLGGSESEGQLHELIQLGLVRERPQPIRKPLANPHDTTASLGERARSYLHANCAHCHHQGGGGATVFDLYHHLPLERTKLVGLEPAQGHFGLDDARVVAPGDPYRSVLLYRMAKQGNGRMPHLGSKKIDALGLKLMHDWIANMPLDDSARTPARLGQVEAQRKQIHSLGLAKRDQHPATLAKLLDQTSGALMLQQAVLGNAPLGQAIKTDRLEIAAAAARHENFRVSELFEQFLPDDQRTNTLGPSPDAAKLLSLTGSPVKGGILFRQAGRTLCVNCHRVQGEGKHIGPDLSQIGARLTRSQLLESLLTPSATIPSGFALYSLEMKSGEVHSGFLLERGKDTTKFRLITGEEKTLPTQGVKSFTELPSSIMPAGLLQTLTPQEAADLLAYLASLR
jgi:putative heme-binding domain-containing protein